MTGSVTSKTNYLINNDVEFHFFQEQKGAGTRSTDHLGGRVFKYVERIV